MNTKKSFIVLLLGLVMVAGCSKRDDAPPSVVDDGVEVGFTVGMAVTQTRVAFEIGLPVTLYVYQRVNPAVMDLTVTPPYKTVTGKTATGATEGMSKIIFDIDGGTSETFQLKRNRTYDFVLIVGSDLGSDNPVNSYNKGDVSGIYHGQDVLVGREEAVLIESSTSEVSSKYNIKFTKFGADNGNLPHLCSGVAVKASVTQERLDADADKSIPLGIKKAVFRKLPKSGTFDFGSDPLKLTILDGGYVSEYNMAANTTAIAVDDPTTVVSYDKGVMLPYPQRNSAESKNTIDIDFVFDIDGKETTITAMDAKVPPFEPGWRYAFRVELDHEKTELYLDVEQWDGTSWESEMGEKYIAVGKWKTTVWESNMGAGRGDKANSYIINPDTNLEGYKINLNQAHDGWMATANKTPSAMNSAVKEFEDLIKGNDWEIVTLWRTWDGANKNITDSKATVITGSPAEYLYPNSYATLDFSKVNVPELAGEGNNAVIALRKKTDPFTIWWSWHLWFTDYAPSATGGTATAGQVHQYLSNAFTHKDGIYKDKWIMDRNLGATATGVTGAITQPGATVEGAVAIPAADAPKYYGMHYQWGRKDPFVGSSDGSNATPVPIYGSDGNTTEKTTNGTGTALNALIKPAVLATSLVGAINNPAIFYTSGSDWTTRNDELWGQSGAKSPFDPCPAGWRIPIGNSLATNNPWAGFADSDPASTEQGASQTAGYLKWRGYVSTITSGGVYEQPATGATAATTAWYPTPGYRHRDTGALTAVGSLGYYWSSSVSGGYGYSLYFTTAGIYPSSARNRGGGFSVRCLQE